AVDLPGLAALQPREEELVERLEKCQQRRKELLAAAAASGRPSGSIGKLAESFTQPQRGKLGRQVKEASARLRLLQHQSLTNWVLAQRSLLHAAQLLEIIATGGRIQPTYGEQGSVPARSSLVNHEA
ncbi:MAG TPA: flagellar export chaperone FlgN, partial [Pirellulaceae bacterium]|nr:flagellar export chaperone FlgN [Pirellulaceae bacterium]